MPQMNYCNIKENTILVSSSFSGGAFFYANANFWLLCGIVFAESGDLFWKSNIPLNFHTGKVGLFGLFFVGFFKAFVRSEQL